MLNVCISKTTKCTVLNKFTGKSGIKFLKLIINTFG